jgi:hypothetical protein
MIQEHSILNHSSRNSSISKLLALALPHHPNPIFKKSIPPTPLFFDVYANKGLTAGCVHNCVQISDLAEGSELVELPFRAAAVARRFAGFSLRYPILEHAPMPSSFNSDAGITEHYRLLLNNNHISHPAKSPISPFLNSRSKTAL